MGPQAGCKYCHSFSTVGVNSFHKNVDTSAYGITVNKYLNQEPTISKISIQIKS